MWRFSGEKNRSKSNKRRKRAYRLNSMSKVKPSKSLRNYQKSKKSKNYKNTKDGAESSKSNSPNKGTPISPSLSSNLDLEAPSNPEPEVKLTQDPSEFQEAILKMSDFLQNRISDPNYVLLHL